MSSAGVVGIFDSLTGGEVLFVLMLALVVLGPERLPEVARTIGQWIAKLKAMTADLQGEMREVMEDPAMQSIREVGEFVAQPRRKLSELVAAAESDAEKEEIAEALAKAVDAEDDASDDDDDSEPVADADAVADSEPVADADTDKVDAAVVPDVTTDPEDGDGPLAAVIHQDDDAESATP